MALEWEIFCQDTIDRTVVAGCFGTGGTTGT
jgi:glutamate/aspartate transport system permease protein